MMDQLFGPPENVPDLYVDSVKIGVGLYTVVLELGLQGPRDTPQSEPVPTKTLARVRMSPQHALILSKLLQKNVAAYISTIGPINVPDSVYRDLDIPKD